MNGQTSQQDFYRLTDNMRPYIERIVDMQIKGLIGAKPAIVTEINGDRCSLLVYSWDTVTNVRVLPGTELQAGDAVLLEYAGSLSNAFVRSRL